MIQTNQEKTVLDRNGGERRNFIILFNTSLPHGSLKPQIDPMIQNPPLTYQIVEKKTKGLLLFLCLIQRNFSTSAALSSLPWQVERAE